MSRLDSLPAPARRVLRGVRRRLAPTAAPTSARPAPVAPPRRHRYVVVVTYGRSGSTLVQGLLNTLPRTLVRGENGFYVLHLFRAERDLRSFRKLHMPHRPQAVHSAFYGLHELRPRRFTRAARTLVVEGLLGSTDPAGVDVLGFKEVLWHRIRDGEMADFFDWLEVLLPDCRYVLQERNLDDVYGSGFWKGVPDHQVRAKVRRVERVQQMLRETRPDRVLDLRYERVTSKDQVVADRELRSIAEFVHGSCDEELLASLRHTLTVGHGPYPFGASRVPGPVPKRGQAAPRDPS